MSSSSSMGASHGLALAATAMALSGTLVLISLCRNKLVISDMASSPPPTSTLRPCLSSEKRKREKGRKKSKKRVRFAEDVVDNEGGGGGGSSRSSPLRRAAAAEPCRGAAATMPANREALYRGMLRDRSMQRATCSY